MTTVIGKKIKAVDTAGNPSLSTAGDYQKNKLGQWIALHPTSGLPAQVQCFEPLVDNPDGTVSSTSPVTVTDAQGHRWTGMLVNSNWVQ